MFHIRAFNVQVCSHNTQGFGERNWAGRREQGSGRTMATDWIINPHGAMPRGFLMPVLQGKHGSHIHVAGIMSLAKLTNLT